MVLATAKMTQNYLFFAGTDQDSDGNWGAWESVKHYNFKSRILIFFQQTTDAAIPSGQWVFLCIGVDRTVNKLYAIRYRIDNTAPNPPDYFYQEKLVTLGSLYPFNRSTILYWGGDSIYSTCSCSFKAINGFLFYTPNSLDQMINLAVGNSASNNLIQ